MEFCNGFIEQELKDAATPLTQAMLEMKDEGTKVFFFGVNHINPHSGVAVMEAVAQNSVKADRLIIEGHPKHQGLVDEVMNAHDKPGFMKLRLEKALGRLEKVMKTTHQVGENARIAGYLKAATIGGIKEVILAAGNGDDNATKRNRQFAEKALNTNIDWGRLTIPDANAKLEKIRIVLTPEDFGLEFPIEPDKMTLVVAGVDHTQESCQCRFNSMNNLTGGALTKSLSNGMAASINMAPNRTVFDIPTAGTHVIFTKQLGDDENSVLLKEQFTAVMV